MSENKDINKPLITDFAYSNEVKKEIVIRFGAPVRPVEKWTRSEELNEIRVETLGYIPVNKLVERAIQAGEDLVLTRLKDGTYSNEEGDDEFHDSPLDDIGTRSLDELYELQRSTAENFYTKKAILNAQIRQKKESEKKEAELSARRAEASDQKKSQGEGAPRVENSALDTSQKN